MANPAKKPAIDSLPQLLQELSEVIGLEAAMQLAAAFPGVAFYVPGKPTPSHSLVPIIGFEALLKLSHYYAQEYLRMPNVAVRKLKHQLVRDLKEQNVSNSQVALQTGYTTRRVEQLNSERKNDDQLDLFGG